MAETLTTRIGLRKHDKGDANWHTPLNSNVDDIDKYIGLTGGDPNVELVPVAFIGQRFFQPNAVAWWVGTTVGTPPTGVWAREIPRGTISAFSGTTAPLGWHLADGTTVVIDTVSLVLPDLRGRFIVGYNSADADYDAIGKTGGAKDHKVVKANIEEFETTDTVVATISTRPAFQQAGTDFNSDATTGTVTIGTPAGSVVRIDHRPPFYTEAWIVKL